MHQLHIMGSNPIQSYSKLELRKTYQILQFPHSKTYLIIINNNNYSQLQHLIQPIHIHNLNCQIRGADVAHVVISEAR